MERKNALDYFVSEIPAAFALDLSIKHIEWVINSVGEGVIGIGNTTEICYIALMSYFEAFCKNQFASLINLCPWVLSSYIERVEKEKSDEDTLSLSIKELVLFDFDLAHRTGSLLAEKINFGTAKHINKQYMRLLGFKPFGTSEIKVYNELLHERNLLVHHGGTYTLKYSLEKYGMSGKGSGAFSDTIALSMDDFNERVAFIRSISSKIVEQSYMRMKSFVEQRGLQLDAERIKAFEIMQYADYKMELYFDLFEPKSAI